jgi:HD-GYP domain-containing protein (c-di-GMP phosphodiesterase class II)
MKRVAVEEGLVPTAVVAGLQEMGFSLWYLPRSEAAETHRLIQEFPPDVVILPLEPRISDVAQRLSETMPTVQIVVAAETATDLEVQPSWADLVVPLDADPIFWLLSLLAMRPETDETEHGPAEWRTMLLTAIEKTHHAFRAMATRRDQEDRVLIELRSRLGDSFEMLLRILLDRLEREIHGFAGHSGRVAKLAGRMASTLGLSEQGVHAVRLAGYLHDLGMHLVLPSQALRRPGPLHQGEWEIVRSHPIASAAVLAPLSEGAAATAAAIREHHERLDGSGYPLSKRGDEVSMEARIVTVADAWEAMTHPRPHRNAVSADQALESLRGEAAAGLLDRDVCETLTTATASG